jgi:hypothetical protein
MRKVRDESLCPLHQSVRRLRGRGTPRNMEAVTISHEQSETMQKIALSIFTDCSNRGLAFSDALTAVYLSGLEHGVTGSSQ